VEGHRRRAPALIALLLLILLCQASPALADDVRPPVASADTNGNGVDVTWTQSQDGGASLVSSGSSSSSCQWHSAPFYGTGPYGATDIAVGVGAAPTPDAQLYIAWCGALNVFFWLSPTTGLTPAAAQPLAEELRRRVEVLPATVSVRPDSRGVTGIPSLFWVDGYDGAPIQQTLTAFGLAVTVTATLTDVAWDFGDGTAPVHAGLGEAWPQHSSVQHNYVEPSTGAGYHVTVTITLAPSFTVNGAGGGPLAPIVLTFARDYRVNEVQAIRNS